MPAVNGQSARLADWMAVLAGTLGALMALMDVSVVNAALPVIQGEIGATQSEGTWVGTAYLVAEIIVIPLSAWLERLMGRRRLMLTGSLIFTLFSIVCGFATSLEMMIIGRIGQGFSGGVLIPAAMTIVATRLPPRQQPVGLALTAMSALLGPVMGPLIGGWLTENYSWHLAFFINVPICLCQVIMLIIGMKPTPGDLHELRNADWFGVGGMILGLGSITTLLEEGHREQWFESALIWQLAIASAIGFAMIAIGQLGKVRPVIRLSLLRNQSLGSASVLMAGVGMLLYTGLFIAPQFLVSIAGYNARQAGEVAFLSGIVSIPVAFLYPVIGTKLDVRVLVATAILLVSIGDYILSGLTTQSTGHDFVTAQFLYGIGTTMAMIPLQQVVISSVPPEDAAEANGLTSVARNLGGSFGLAGLASFQEQRFDYHHWQINASLSANDPELQSNMANTATMFGSSMEAAYRMLDGEVMRQALVMAFNDVYLAIGAMALLSIPFAFFLRPVEPGSATMAMH